MKFAIILAAICAGLWAFVHFAFPDYSHRFRLTVEVETPDGVRSGSSVMESILIDNGYLPTPGRRLNVRLTGEAVLVDLGGGRNLIALISLGPHGENVDQFKLLALRAWGLQDTVEGWASVSSQHGQAVLLAKDIPTLITLGDLSNPKSARLVTPGELASRLGIDVRLKRVWVEMTRDPITIRIEKVMPWLGTEIGVMDFWRAIYASGFRPTGSVEAKLLLRSGR